MKKLFTTILACLAVTCVMAQGWPANYGGVMLQGFYWDYYDDSEWGTWNALKGQANDLEGYIDLIWVPNSARTKNDWCVEHGTIADMGYMPCWWLNHSNTIFGSESDLKSMIAAYKAKGIGIIEDVVINHKNGQNDWCDFPNEHVVGTKGTYDLNWTLADICNNDNGGYVRTMFDITGAADTGDDFDGCRDLDHTGANVQQNVKTYLDYLQKELGYAGFRYDMVKGYGPQYVGVYNAYAKPTFSVGEYWDDWGGTTWWVNGTKQNDVVQSAAFDFPLKFLINNAFSGNSFNQDALSTFSAEYPQALAGNSYFNRYSVTFVDNHDTYRDETKMRNDHHVLAANAFILSMPGTPCIFLPHWKTHKGALKRMIAARKAAGITNQSTFESYICNNGGGRSFHVHGSKATILLLLGDCGYTPSEDDYRSVWNGDENNWNFKMYISKSVSEETLGAVPSGSNANLGTPRVDMASGTYYQSVTVNVSPSDNFTTLVYTTDDSEPTTSSSTIPEGGKSFTYTEGTNTLKVGVKNGESVTNIQTYYYNITNEAITDITIYVRADKEPLYLYAWDDNGTLTSDWPGTQLSAMKSANDVNFYYMTFPKPSADYKLKYILNQGSDATKTKNNENISSTIFTALGNANEYAVDLTATYASATIEAPIETEPITVYVKGDFGPAYLYTWDGYSVGNWPGTKMSTTLINGHTWFYYTMPKSVRSFKMIVNQGQDQPQSYEYYISSTTSSTTYLQYHGGGQDLTPVESMSVYPIEAWFGQGEICAFFVNYDWDINSTINAYVYNGNTNYAGNWPGTACTYLGYNEHGGKIWKWNYNGASLPEGTIIIFNNGSKQTANCTFTNGAWYSSSNENNTNPISTAVEPSEEIPITNLGTTSPTVNNWDGKSEKVAQETSDGTTNKTMSKTFSLAAGSYVVQAIVRGTSGGTVTLSANNLTASVGLTGLDGAKSSVQPNGIVDTNEPGNNNGWQKVEVAFTLASDEMVTVTLTSAAEQWQLGDLKVLPGTIAKTKATTGVGLDNAYIDLRGESDFSFFERGENLNALIKAAANTLPTLLPYNVIVDGKCENLKLTDGNYSFNNSGSKFTSTNVSYDRTFQKTSTTRGESQLYKTSTICLPFGLTAAEAAAAGTFWELDSYNASTGEIIFKKVETTEANTPYLFEAIVDKPFLSITGKEVPTSSLVTVEKDGISFIGVNTRTNLVSGNGVTYYGYSDNEFVKAGTGTGANINPFRAYLMTASTNATSRINVLFDGKNGDETGIKVVKPEVKPMKEQPIYNLSGQRIKTPAKKGIYVMGGKKIIVK